MVNPSQKVQRLDTALVESGAFDSRARAQGAIKAGLVRVDGRAAIKVSTMVRGDAAIDVAGDAHPFVSRGGVKLVAVLDAFNIDPAGLICLDLGASTGGFTDLLIRRGAAKVYAVDVGRGQLHAAIRSDARVVNLEQTHAKDLDGALIPDPIGLIVCDVSFISLKKALPRALALASPDGQIAALVKPQFEVGRARIGKGGIVKPGRENAEGVAEDIAEWLGAREGWTIKGYIESPVTGGDGNREFLIAAAKKI